MYRFFSVWWAAPLVSCVDRRQGGRRLVTFWTLLLTLPFAPDSLFRWTQRRTTTGRVGGGVKKPEV